MAALYTIGLFYPAIPLPEGLMASGLPRRMRSLLSPEYTAPQFVSHLWQLFVGNLDLCRMVPLVMSCLVVAAINGSGRARIILVRLSRSDGIHFYFIALRFRQFSFQRAYFPPALRSLLGIAAIKQEDHADGEHVLVFDERG
jgi:hypothetical protein